jgi:uncharacterized membrane protein required for colicin V production
MTLDAVALFILALLVHLGWRSGAIVQVTKVVAAVGVFALSPQLSEPLREVVFQRTDLSEPLVEAASIAMTGLLVYVAISVTGWLLVKAIRGTSETLSRMDRGLGATLGSLKAALLVYFLLLCVALLQVPIEEVDPRDRLRLRDGYSFEIARHDLVLAPLKFPDLERLHVALRVGDRVEREELHADLRRDHRRAADLLVRDDVRELLEDGELLEAATSDVYPRTLADERVRTLLHDEDFVRHLRGIQWEYVESELGAKPEEGSQPRGGARADADAVPEGDDTATSDRGLTDESRFSTYLRQFERMAR